MKQPDWTSEDVQRAADQILAAIPSAVVAITDYDGSLSVANAVVSEQDKDVLTANLGTAYRVFDAATGYRADVNEVIAALRSE